MVTVTYMHDVTHWSMYIAKQLPLFIQPVLCTSASVHGLMWDITSKFITSQ